VTFLMPNQRLDSFRLHQDSRTRRRGLNLPHGHNIAYPWKGFYPILAFKLALQMPFWRHQDEAWRSVESQETFMLDKVDALLDQGHIARTRQQELPATVGGHQNGGDSEAVVRVVSRPCTISNQTKRGRSRKFAAAPIPSRADARDWRGERSPAHAKGLLVPAHAIGQDRRCTRSRTRNPGDEKYQLDRDLFSRTSRDRTRHGHRTRSSAGRTAIGVWQRPS
jgi:hypothetical protein